MLQRPRPRRAPDHARAGGRDHGRSCARTMSAADRCGLGGRDRIRHAARRRSPLRRARRRDEPAAHELVAIAEVSLLGTPRSRARASLRPHDAGRRRRRRLHLHASYVRALWSGTPNASPRPPRRSRSLTMARVLIHCFAGKDRTGIVAALLLCARRCPGRDRRHRLRGERAERRPAPGRLGARPRRRRRATDAQPPDPVAARRDAAGVLAWLGDAGGAEGYLRAAGLSDVQLGRLRARLVSACSAAAAAVTRPLRGDGVSDSLQLVRQRLERRRRRPHGGARERAASRRASGLRGSRGPWR